MKIIATTHDNGYSHSRIFLVEMTASEFEVATGMSPDVLKVGSIADLVKDWQQLRSLQRQAEASKRAAEGFRALAEMTDMLSAQFAKVVGTEAGKEAS